MFEWRGPSWFYRKRAWVISFERTRWHSRLTILGFSWYFGFRD